MMRETAASVLLLAGFAGLIPADALWAFQKRPASLDDESTPYGLSPDCEIVPYNICPGYIWVFHDDPGAVWGHVFDPQECPAACREGATARSILLYTRCIAPPAELRGIRLVTVDANNCPTALLCETGRMPPARSTEVPSPCSSYGEPRKDSSWPRTSVCAVSTVRGEFRSAASEWDAPVGAGSCRHKALSST